MIRWAGFQAKTETILIQYSTLLLSVVRGRYIHVVEYNQKLQCGICLKMMFQGCNFFGTILETCLEITVILVK